jgi:hypothetical protein
MSLDRELEGLARLLGEVVSLYHRCRGFDAPPSMVAQLDEALSSLMEGARGLGGLGQAIRLAAERGLLRQNPMRLVEVIERAQRLVRERMALFEGVGLDPGSPEADKIWGLANSPLLCDPDLWRGRMGLERLRELIDAGEGVFDGDEDPEILWRAIQAAKDRAIRRRVEGVLRDLRFWIESFFKSPVREVGEMVVQRYGEYRWLMDELGEPAKSLEAIIAEAWGSGCAKLLLDWDDPEIDGHRRILGEFMDALDSARSWLERAGLAADRREAMSNLTRARYFADKLMRLLPEVEALAGKHYAGYLRFVKEAREVLQRLEGVRVSEEDYMWVRLELEGEQASLDSFLMG